MRALAVAAAVLAVGYAAPGHAQCSFTWSCKGNSGCMSVMQRPNGVASGASDMAACNAARRKWASMGVPPTSECTCAGGAGGAASGSFSATNPFAVGQAIIANAHQQAQNAARANENFSAGLSDQQAQLLGAAEQEKWRQYKAEEERTRRKREELLASLTRGIGNTELGARGSTETIDLRAGTSFFGRPSNATGTVTTVVPGAIIESLKPPPTPEGRPVDPGGKERADAAWSKALEEKDRAVELQRKLEAEKKESERNRAAAERKYQEQQAKVQTVPTEQAEKRKEEDDKLAEAEKLLKEATELDQNASDKLDRAENQARQAQQQVERADQARAHFNSPAPTAAQPPQ
jgi:hypothetical protein